METKVQSGRLLRWLTVRFGRKIYNQQDGRLLGKAFFVPWKGSILIIGYTGIAPLRPITLPTQRLDYWRQTIGFTGPREPNFLKRS
jgi:hypothetical protein